MEQVPAERCNLIDVDGDGWLDVCAKNQVFLSLRGAGWGPGRELGPGLSYCVWADLDSDGRLDGLGITRQTAAEFAQTPRHHRVFLSGQWLDSQEFALPFHWNTLGVALSDLDRDGKLDVAFGQAYMDESKGYEAQQMRVYAGHGDGRFVEKTEEWGFLTPGPPGAANGGRPLYGLSAADLDNDGFPELLGAAYGRQWNTLWKRGVEAVYSECGAKYGLDGDSIRHGQYSEATREKFRQRNQPRPDELPFRSNGNTFCLAPADFDGDGDLDVFSADITHSWAGDSSDLSALLINRWETFQEPFFERCIEVLAEPDPETGFAARPTRGLARDHAPQPATNWNQGDLQAHWVDLDCDGRLDLIVCESDYPGNRLRIFLQNSDHSFREAEKELGIDFNNCPGVAVGDLDRDGDPDLITLGTRTRWPEARPKPELVLWRNGSANASLNLRLVGDGKTANRDAIGARIYLETDQGTQMRELQGSYGHWGQQTQPGEAHFGLGGALPKKIRIVWPDRAASQTLIENPPTGGWLVIHQAGGESARMNRFEAGKWIR
ncbi:MAG: CRTAC1 family protein [Candidatus Eremiobacteraeota bacterium]|nr:CRTAC1 family protein [Candidatus Eremiobacteraeota bacterium]